MHLLSNVIRDYAWGSTVAIPELLGVPQTGEPQAEMWLGAHPDSPSTVSDGRGLDQVIAADPETTLGDHAGPSDQLPFLMKVLAAGSPLSLQVHPTKAAAMAGYAAEEAQGVPHDAPERRYKDDHHKPEMVLALTEFDALCGLRDQAGALALVDSLQVAHPDWVTFRERLAAADGVRSAFTFVLHDADHSLVAAVAEACERAPQETDPGIPTVVMLNKAYPGDPGVVGSLLLNCVTLKPGEALYLPAGNVHAYLNGLAIEVLASSDNVLRAGLTPKYIDVDEVLRTVDFTPLPVPYVRPTVAGVVTQYRPGADEFAFAMAQLTGSEAVENLPATGPRIALSLDDDVTISCRTGETTLGRGDSVFLADADGPISLTGTGRVAITCLPSALPAT